MFAGDKPKRLTKGPMKGLYVREIQNMGQLGEQDSLGLEVPAQLRLGQGRFDGSGPVEVVRYVDHLDESKRRKTVLEVRQGPRVIMRFTASYEVEWPQE